MLRKCFLVPALAIVAFLLVADMAQAQRIRERRFERREVRRGVVVVAPVVAGTVVDASSTERTSNYPPTLETGNGAQIVVMLPDPQARVMFDGAATKQVGTNRVFTTPPLTAGVTNSYRIQATFMQNGREVTQERVVTVSPGGRFVVVFPER